MAVYGVQPMLVLSADSWGLQPMVWLLGKHNDYSFALN